MALILHMDTDAVRAMGQQLQQQAEISRAQAQTILAALHGMAWLGPSRDMFLSDAEQWQTVIQSYANEAEKLGQRLLMEAEEWENMALGQPANPITPLTPLQLLSANSLPSTNNIDFTQVSDGLLNFSRDTFESAEFLENVVALGSTALLTFTVGGKYGDLLVRANAGFAGLPVVGNMLTPAAIRASAGLSSHLTHISGAALIGHIGNEALKSSLSWTGIALASGEQWVADVQTYKDDPAMMASALVTDTVVLTTANALGSSAGAMAGAVVGQMLIPIPGVGAVIGGVVGRIVGGEMAKSAAFDFYQKSGARDVVIQEGAQVVRDVSSAANNAIQNAVQMVQAIPWPKFL